MKLLIIRFSSIGDIVLTTPLLRVLAQADEKHEIHYVTKKKYLQVIAHNPYISKIHTFEHGITEVEKNLQVEHFDFVLDLHHNLRSHRLIATLGRPSKSFNKLNYEKWIAVNFKWNILPAVHIVKRYFDPLSFLNLKYDGQGLDYFTGEIDSAKMQSFDINFEENFIVFVVGGAHATKQIPEDILIKIAANCQNKIVLLGGKDDVTKANNLALQIGVGCHNLTAQLSLNESAWVVSKSTKVLTSDTGLMHIAAAYKKEIISLWGNTIPEFGMYPLMPLGLEKQSHIFEVKGLKCRPCSKIGFKTCPKKHFHCMTLQDIDGIREALHREKY